MKGEMLTSRRPQPTRLPVAAGRELDEPADPAHTETLLGFDRAAFALFDFLPVNVMVADTDLVIRFANRQSVVTLQRLRHLLPVAPEHVVGSSIDIFHRQPTHQRRILSQGPGAFPHQATIQLGDEYLDLNIEMATDGGRPIGFVVAWSVHEGVVCA